MMSALARRVISTSRAPRAIGPYSQAVIVGGTMYISGQLGLLPTTMDFPSEDVELQTHQVFTNLKVILEEAGLTLKDVVKTTVLLSSMNDFAKVNAIYAEYFKEPFPARSTFEVACLPKDAKVEIEAIAAVTLPTHE